MELGHSLSRDKPVGWLLNEACWGSESTTAFTRQVSRSSRIGSHETEQIPENMTIRNAEARGIIGGLGVVAANVPRLGHFRWRHSRLR